MRVSQLAALALFASTISSLAAATERPPLIDAHLHYNADHAAALTPAGVVDILQRNDVAAAIVTARPPETALTLAAVAPERIVPFLGVYRTTTDKETWHQDPSVVARLQDALRDPRWQGIGELHLFAEHRHSPVLREIARIAAARGLPLLMHTDPVTIDTLFEREPTLTVFWAHAGAYPYPPLLRDYFARYPGLYVDLSMRDERVAPHGQLAPEWELLILEYPERFMVGVDTFSLGRWEAFDTHAARVRDWLDALPADVAARLRCENAARLLARAADTCRAR